MVFRNDIFNPIYESGDKITPDINPKYVELERFCPKMYHLLMCDLCRLV